MHIHAPLDDFLKAKHEFAADHDELKKTYHKDIVESEVLAETKFFDELLEYFTQMQRDDELFCYPALKSFQKRGNTTKPVVPVGYSPPERLVRKG